MRSLFAILLCLSALCAQPAQAARPLPTPKLVAMYFYADWCPNCKALSPRYDELRKAGGYDSKPILFVTLDLTDKATINQSILHAQALGFGNFLKAQGSSTGYIAVLDAKSKKELARFDRSSDNAAMAKTLERLLAE